MPRPRFLNTSAVVECLGVRRESVAVGIRFTGLVHGIDGAVGEDRRIHRATVSNVTGEGIIRSEIRCCAQTAGKVLVELDGVWIFEGATTLVTLVPVAQDSAELVGHVSNTISGCENVENRPLAINPTVFVLVWRFALGDIRFGDSIVHITSVKLGLVLDTPVLDTTGECCRICNCNNTAEGGDVG